MIALIDWYHYEPRLWKRKWYLDILNRDCYLTNIFGKEKKNMPNQVFSPTTHPDGKISIKIISNQRKKTGFPRAKLTTGVKLKLQNWFSSMKHCQDNCLEWKNPRWARIEALRQFVPNKMIQQIDQAQKLIWIDPLGSTYLGSIIRDHIGLLHLRQICWQQRW